MERMMTLPTCGLRYGDSSSAKDEGIPFNMVLDRTLDINSVTEMPSTIAVNMLSAAATSPKDPAAPAMNIVESAISVGKRPLHGTKLFVIIAISRSRGESMILQDMTPAALHPKPMHMGG